MPENRHTGNGTIAGRNTEAAAELMLVIRLFVYGTLKRGFANHERFCSRARSIEPAVVWGRLYHLPAGYPALEVPESSVLAYGTPDPRADAQTQDHAHSLLFQRPAGDWDLIKGELATFDDPELDLPPIDRLEGFDPGGHSLYRRVLTTARTSRGLLSAWVYVMEGVERGRRIGGEWQA